MATRGPNGLYPMDTPIADMDLNAHEKAMLTDNSKKLIKRHLVVLRETAKEFREVGSDKIVEVFKQKSGFNDLTIGDLYSIPNAFDTAQDRINSNPSTINGDACCSCCPCCSCASVVIDANR